MARNPAKARQHLEVELLLFENYSLSSYTLSSKNNRRYSKKMYRKQIRLLNRSHMISENESEDENEK